MTRLNRLNRRRYALAHAQTILIVAIAAYYVSGHWEGFRQLMSISPAWLPVLGMALIGSLIFRVWFLQQLVVELSATITARQSFCLLGASNLLDALTLPAVGMACRAFYLRRRCCVPFVSYAAALAIFSLARVFVWGVAVMTAEHLKP